MNDRDFLHTVLADNRWHGWNEIMRRSNKERGCGLTIHSRISDLRRRGHTIECRTEQKNGRSTSSYRLVHPLDAAMSSSAAQTPALPSSGIVASSGPDSNPAVVIAGADGAPGRRDDSCPLSVPGQLVLEGVAA